MGNEQHLLNQALALAASVHAGQRDKEGKPYMLHVLRVGNNVHTIEHKIVAALHDVLEDSHFDSFVRPEGEILERGVEEGDLIQLGFSEAIVRGVVSVTRNNRPSTEPYADFIQRAAKDPLGRVVKLADIYDHLREGYETVLGARHIDRYQKARKVLLRAIERG